MKAITSKLFAFLFCFIFLSSVSLAGNKGRQIVGTDTLTTYIKNQTVGGKLDFNKLLESDTQGMYLQDGIAYNKKDYAIFLWAMAVRKMGLKTVNEALGLYQEILQRKLISSEKKALKAGFKKG